MGVWRSYHIFEGRGQRKCIVPIHLRRTVHQQGEMGRGNKLTGQACQCSHCMQGCEPPMPSAHQPTPKQMPKPKRAAPKSAAAAASGTQYELWFGGNASSSNGKPPSKPTNVPKRAVATKAAAAPASSAARSATAPSAKKAAAAFVLTYDWQAVPARAIPQGGDGLEIHMPVDGKPTKARIKPEWQVKLSCMGKAIKVRVTRHMTMAQLCKELATQVNVDSVEVAFDGEKRLSPDKTVEMIDLFHRQVDLCCVPTNTKERATITFMKRLEIIGEARLQKRRTDDIQTLLKLAAGDSRATQLLAEHALYCNGFALRASSLCS